MSRFRTSALFLVCVAIGCQRDAGIDEGSAETQSNGTGTSTDTSTGSSSEAESDSTTDTTDDGELLPELVAYRSFGEGSMRDIFLIDPSNGASEPLTVGELTSSFAWSPDGMEIAAALDVAGAMDVYRITVADGEIVQLTDDFDDERQLQWSPDGSVVAFVSTAGTNSIDVMVVSNDGAATWQISDIAGALDLSFDWSPDGDQLAVAAMTGDAAELFVFEADGSGGQQLTVGGQYDQIDAPAWSPDGEWIAFSGRNDVLPLLQLMRPDGSEVMPGSAVFVSQPSWSPDGQSIAFRGHDQGDFRIGVMAVGGDPWYVDDGLVDCWSPDWSPDGSRVLFFCQPELDVASIYLAATESGVVTPLVDDGLRNDQPAWRPNSAP